MPESYSLAELADVAGVTVRTVRYYVAQGLLASPGSGPSARYSEGHLLRLRLIKQLQAQHLPLAEIRQRLAQLSDDQIRELLAERGPAKTSAMDYIRSVLGGPATATTPLGMHASPRMESRLTARLADLSAAMPDALVSRAGLAEPSAPAPAEPLFVDSEIRQPDRSQWDRIALAADVELHVRRPLSRLQNKRVERLISIARRILEEDQP